MFSKFPITENMHIHSLEGELREATILGRLGDNDYLAEYNGVKCQRSTTRSSIISMWMTSMASSGTKSPAGTNRTGNDHRSKARASRAGFVVETR